MQEAPSTSAQPKRSEASDAEITVTIERVDGKPKIKVSPLEMPIGAGQRIPVKVDGEEHFDNFLGVEIHVPGNEERRLMHRSNGRADVVYFKRRGEPIRDWFLIGPKPVSGPHEYRVFAHFEGSVETLEVTTSNGGHPTMIVR